MPSRAAEHETGWPRFGSVRLRFGDGTVRAVPVFGPPAVPLRRGFLCVSVQFSRENGTFCPVLAFLENVVLLCVPFTTYVVFLEDGSERFRFGGRKGQFGESSVPKP